MASAANKKKDLESQTQKLKEKITQTEDQLRALKAEAQKLRAQIAQFSIKFKGLYSGLVIERDIYLKRVDNSQ